MDTQFIATVYGAEQSGIMKCLADETHRLGGKWVDSRMSQLDGQFIGLIKISVPQNNEEELKAFFLTNKNINSQFNDVSTVGSTSSSIVVHLDAKDRAGLVSDISTLFANLSIEVDSMEAHRVAVNELGGNMFTSEFNLRVPTGCNLIELEKSLKDIQPGSSVKISH